jgi:hypothetical protein
VVVSFLEPDELGIPEPGDAAAADWLSPAVMLPIPPTLALAEDDTVGVLPLAVKPLVPIKEPTLGLGREATTAFMRLPTKVLRLLNSVFSSLSLPSVLSFCASIAFGIRSFRFLTSSPIRLASSSRLWFVVFSSPITASTSCNAESRRSVRVCSEALRASVSVDNWSRRANALVKASSIYFLSCSSCGGVGGAMRG